MAEGKRYVVPVRYGQLLQVAEFFCATNNLRKGDRCVIRTERGLEVGVALDRPARAGAADESAEAGEKRREVVRRVSDQDRKKLQLLDREGRTRELAFARERAAARSLRMRLIRAEHLFGGDKIVFYFSADGRVDFRGLVRDLADQFKCKIQLRQIGARDEARLLGDVNSCGQTLCCQTYIKEFAPVTMKMAKNQMTTLDPAKITGRCGRLMCCLRHEDTTYTDHKRKLPRKGSLVQTAEGRGRVVSLLTLARQVVVSLDGRRQLFAAEEVRPVDAPAPAPPPTQASRYISAPPLWHDREPDTTALYTMMVADALARLERQRGSEVMLTTLVARYPRSAQAGGKTPSAAGAFLETLEERLGLLAIDAELVSTDNALHRRTVDDFCRRLLNVGDLYKREVDGAQCLACYLTLEGEPAKAPRCPSCGAELEPLTGEAYFFKLGRFDRKLLARLLASEEAIRPRLARLDLEARIKAGLSDMAVARADFARGLPFPGDHGFRLAGWFESLLGYVSCLIEKDNNERFYAYWPAQRQLLPRDQLWIHGVWLAMLLASEVELPRQLLVTGVWREPGDALGAAELLALAREAGPDVARYALLRGLPFGLDGTLEPTRLGDARSELEVVETLVRRLVTLIDEHFDGHLPHVTRSGPPRAWEELLGRAGERISVNLRRLQFDEALAELRQAWDELAALLDQVKPWRLAARGAIDQAADPIYATAEVLYRLASLTRPLLPRTAERLALILGADPGGVGAPPTSPWGTLQPGGRIDGSLALFNGPARSRGGARS